MMATSTSSTAPGGEGPPSYTELAAEKSRPTGPSTVPINLIIQNGFFHQTSDKLFHVTAGVPTAKNTFQVPYQLSLSITKTELEQEVGRRFQAHFGIDLTQYWPNGPKGGATGVICEIDSLGSGSACVKTKVIVADAESWEAVKPLIAAAKGVVQVVVTLGLRKASFSERLLIQGLLARRS